jgi:hypothetical protein
MNFKNDLERQCFEIAEQALGKGVTIEHNKKIQIESALFPEVASFKGPPAKEVDVLVAELTDQPKVVLLVSCKLFSRRAEPAHIQEWCAVVQAMNRYSDGTLFLGLVVSPSGFTSGCEAWATSHNIGIVPPLKGRNLTFNPNTVLRMFKRVLTALRSRVSLKSDDFRTAPAFFDFVFRLVADFEGHQNAAINGRYFLLPQNWTSSFGEMYSAIAGRTVEDFWAVDGATVMLLSGTFKLIFREDRVCFGRYIEITEETLRTSECRKNINMEPCTLEFIKNIAIGKTVTSAGDFGSYIEFGIDQRFNLGLHRLGFHLVSTEEPIELHRL